MAKDLGKRVVSAIVFFLFFVFAGIHQYAFAAVFSFFSLVSLGELISMAEKKGIEKNVWLYPLSLAIFLFFYFYFQKLIDFQGFILVLLFVFLFFIVRIFRDKTFENVSFFVFAILYIALPFGLMNFLVFYDGFFDIHLFALFFIIIWLNDIGAYFAGVSLGKHKLAPSISPKKTVEGFIGGIISSVAGAILYFHIFGKFSLWENLLLSLGLSIFATLGDLFESKLKREAGVKDSGKIMPGHGGLLDRFDSSIFGIIFVVAFWFVKNQVL